MKLKFICFLVLPAFFISAQSQIKLHESLQWNIKPDAVSMMQSTEELPTRQIEKTDPNIFPIYKKIIDLNGPGTIRTQFISMNTANVQLQNKPLYHNKLNSDFQIHAAVYKSRGVYKAVLEVIPMKFNSSGNYEILKDFDIQMDFEPAAFPNPLPNFTFQSVLSTGEWHKISIPKNSIYKIDKAFLEKNLKVNFNNFDPRNFHLYGNGGNMLPESNDADFIDDLEENAVYIKGESDGKMDDGDFILFYAKGPDAFSYNPVQKDYTYQKNTNSDLAYYFIKIDNTRGKRISNDVEVQNPDYNSNTSFDFKHYERDLVNLLEIDPSNEGSGKNWFGAELSNTREFDFGSEFLFDNVDQTKNGKFSFGFAGRAPVNQTITAIVESKQSAVNLSAVSINSSISAYADTGYGSDEFKPVADIVRAKLVYKDLGSIVSEGWMDYFQVSVWKKLIWNSKPLYIMDPNATTHQVTEFLIKETGTGKYVWDISNPLSIKNITYKTINNDIAFNATTINTYKQFLVLDDNGFYESPEYVGAISNQNLHGIKDADMIIIYNKIFKEDAERLQNHRSKYSGLKVESLELSQVYNEFSSGTQDPSAIRNMMRMIYQRNPNFKFLLLIGDGSYDLRHINKKNVDQNLMITYETDESLDPIYSFPSDDYYGLLDPGEGKNLVGLLDISIGRICARTIEESKIFADKIIRYDSEPRTMEDWRLNIVFSADDEDGNTHLIQAEGIANRIHSRYPLFNQEKIYLDAYDQITTPGGERYPEVNKAYGNAFYQGSLVVNYMGHGGYSGLAQERVLQNTDIKVLENYLKLPLVIIASCTFNGFDDPTRTTGGEEGLFNPRGGFLALFSTVRDVYSSNNLDLTESVYDYLFEFENKTPLPIGEIMRRAKNDNSNIGVVLNSRKFLLFGDPSQKLAIPVLKNSVNSINDKPLNAVPDTFRALETVRVKGSVINQSGDIQSDFSGKLYATIFDKEIELRTKGNDPFSYPKEFNLQRNIIYKGSVEVKNGDWEFSFIIPKDINYEFGKGKMSLYATDEKSRDAAGYESGFIVGGVSNDSINDDNPPVVKVFLNDVNFVSGGISDPNPKLYAQISDDFGINISGNSIGHDLTAVIDQNSQSPIILNQVYKSKLNNPKEGELSYPLKNLSPGKHTITVTAWDISNNSGQGSTEFIVIDPDKLALDRVLNYPNPFSNHTEFQFETNLVALEMEVVVQVQSISGKLVKTLQKTIQPSGYRIAGISWDGKDDFGGDLANGVYLYRLSINAKMGSETIHKTSDFQKLVMLR